MRNVLSPSEIPLTLSPTYGTTGWSEQQIILLQEGLDRILASHHFQGSKRCQAFLRYAVAETLSGRCELKERSIGIEAFDRDPSYDTNQDPVVRITAGEVRKRLALYYQDALEPHGFRVELPVGSYIPKLQLGPIESRGAKPESSSLENKPEQKTASVALDSSPVDVPSTREIDRGNRANFAIGVGVLIAVCAAFLAWGMHHSASGQSALKQFWAPFVTSPSAAFLSIGQIRPVNAEVEPNRARSSVQGAIALQGSGGYPREIAVTVLDDALTMTDIAALLRTSGKQISMHPESTTSFADLERGPFILVGAFDNDWSILYTDPLRFHFAMDATQGRQWIADREHADRRIGVATIGTPVAQLKSDYAIVARFYDDRTKQIVVIAAGITPYGTRAAGTFLTDPTSLQGFARGAPRDWNRKNMEVVLRTDLIDGEPGAPVVVDQTFW